MIQLLGKGYIIDHCLCNLRKISDENIFRIYVTDALKAIANNTSKSAQEDSYLNLRYIEIIDNKTKNEKSKETAEQIKMRIMAGVNSLAK